MYGSTHMRVLYGSGDYGRSVAMAQMTRGYYQAGGFFSSLTRAIGLKPILSKVGAIAGKALTGGLGGKLISGIGGKLLRGVPILGTALTAFDIGKDIYQAATSGPKVASSGGAAGLPTFGAAASQAAGLVERGGGGKRRRRRAASRGRGRSRAAPRRRRSSRPRGDYGDDWQGNKPSYTKHGHRFLTRAGGRHHKKRRRSRRHRGGAHVSFTTKSGKHVSFTARH
jgi:hypothetical protein